MKTFPPATLYHNFGGASFIPLNIFGFPQTVEVLGKTWYRKNEFHTTIIYVKRIVGGLSAAKGISEPVATQQVWEAVEAAHEESAADFRITPTEELRYAKDEKQETLAAMVNVTNLEPLFEKLRSELDYADLEIPPTHITIYTDPDGAIGVPIPTQQALAERTRQLEGDELEMVRQVMRFDDVLG